MALSLVGLVVVGCGGGGGASDSANVTLKAVASKTQPVSLGKFATSSCSSSEDTPDGTADGTAGNDCDGDGGVVTFSTPQKFLIAVRQAGVIDKNGDKHYFINKDNLATSEVFDITEMIDLHTSSLPNGTYTHLFVEFYYFALKLELYTSGQYEHLRIYLSDDDFADEGNLGHHQGDITLTNENNIEEGFLAPGREWSLANLLPQRFDNGTQLYASSPDSQTGHQRGPYGNNDLWNQDSFNQGANQDKFYVELPIDLVVSSSSKNITMQFNIKDSWYFEDFNGNGIFGPARDTGSGITEAGDEKATWSPILNEPDVSVE
jgi:hypothetical protein